MATSVAPFASVARISGRRRHGRGGPLPHGAPLAPGLTNKKLRGRQVEVWVLVNESGRVVPDSTRLRPPTSDRKFNERLIEEASEWVFETAKQGGQPIATGFPYTISM